MAAMTTALTEFSQNGNSRTSTLSGHTAIKPQLVIEKRRVAAGNSTTVESTITVHYATEDSDGEVLTSKVVFEATVKYPLLAQSTDITAALAVFRDIVAGDEFANTVTTQEWLT